MRKTRAKMLKRLADEHAKKIDLNVMQVPLLYKQLKNAFNRKGT